MKTRSIWLAGVLAACALGGSAGAIAVTAQTHDHGAAGESPTAVAPAQNAVPMHDRMMAEMRDRDTKLESLVKTMDGATGDARIETMAAILRELVQTEKAMHAAMNEMRPPAAEHDHDRHYIH